LPTFLLPPTSAMTGKEPFLFVWLFLKMGVHSSNRGSQDTLSGGVAFRGGKEGTNATPDLKVLRMCGPEGGSCDATSHVPMIDMRYPCDEDKVYTKVWYTKRGPWSLPHKPVNTEFIKV